MPNYTQQAGAAVDKLEKIRDAAEEAESQAQERLREIQRKEPVFAQMDRVIKDAVGKLALLFQDFDGLWTFTTPLTISTGRKS